MKKSPSIKHQNKPSEDEMKKPHMSFEANASLQDYGENPFDDDCISMHKIPTGNTIVTNNPIAFPKPIQK